LFLKLTTLDIKNQRYGLQCRYFELQLEHKGKKAKASICGRGPNEWKGEKPVIETALKSIEEKMNPQLPFSATVQ
jgi:ORF11CD3 domain